MKFSLFEVQILITPFLMEWRNLQMLFSLNYDFADGEFVI